ncbi:thermonuclease family protein [Aquibium sp. A9E412]|uniref:thermonuclease family protein n=1 Tax=Aquibium sp. A9E412 TaxID=2976767 RepID=UPI0025B25497|nr:thermonuclease family protein [Aquibium sp. A9E412]MDN2568357.1 thermonuclease family protein [Aquibium sp. A9E412]
MARPATDLARLKARIEARLAGGRLDRWQRDFLSDIAARIDRYRQNTRLSDRQLAKVREIVGEERAAAEAGPGARVVALPVRQRRRGVGTGWRRGSRPAYRLLREGVLIAALFAALAALQMDLSLSAPVTWLRTLTVPADGRSAPGFAVTDGDTIRLYGERRGLRLVGFNAPETVRPQCARERALGERARARLKALVASGETTLKVVPCACPPGTQGTQACNYGRSCGILRVDGRDVGRILISEGLAVPYACGPAGCPPAPRPWCG